MSEDLIRKIADTLEIQHLKAVYCFAADMVTHDPAKAKDILQSIFMPEARADYGAAICEGRDALVGYLVNTISEMEDWLLHGLQTPLIDIDGDKASGKWVIMVQNKQKHLPGKEMLVGRYYMDKKDFTGAINRFKIVVTQYQTTRHVEEALARLTEAYMALGVVGEAQTAAAVLGHNFPDSRWYNDAYKLVKSGGVEPQENKGSWISRAFKKLGYSELR